MLKYCLEQTSTKYMGMKQVYQYIHENGPITKAQLVDKMQMKQTTVNRYLENLLSDNIIKISHYQESSGGRPPALFEMEPNAGYIIGVELSRIESSITLVNMSFEIIESYTFVMTERHTPSYTIPIIIKKIEHFIEKYNISDDFLLGIGIGTVGPLDRENGVILDPNAFIAKGWKDISIIEELKKIKTDKILLENGANVATLHSAIKDNTKDKTILYCISGRGLRCGVLADGHILKNKTGDASSFGEMIIDVKNQRSLTSCISYDYLLKEVNKRYLDNELSEYFDVDGNQRELMDQLMDSLANENKIVREVVLESAQMYGVGIANIINILHPDQVVLSSELVKAYPPYYEKIVESAKEYIYRMDREPIHFLKESRSERTISIGAAVLIFQSYF
ncbi:Sugar kinase of the NBD/HSP70 family, may contain an N-terminal HTH domain [Gracilibacillus orientalis]|uniref:Sugar kinase of the NBD/HSP70 family, may contain an N-terminal HTH domain n=1 Tax=Gracilibacillus orientalis TaxID=334253 RepID=A0A1I4HKB7_9BACI|nr:ROK family transcriptional regulator [Gracilibacillus orientalis]SFL41981.1 Sugar kinase of the NBD/HSP70 family, may contain an N-terminal HTH domain [Gracilibacillus orientalis]